MKTSLPYLAASALFLVACSAEPAEPEAYDQNSWKTMISEDCQSFFDGCNNCRREAGAEIAACTRKACMEYQAPKCLDE